MYTAWAKSTKVGIHIVHGRPRLRTNPRATATDYFPIIGNWSDRFVRRILRLTTATHFTSRLLPSNAQSQSSWHGQILAYRRRDEIQNIKHKLRQSIIIALWSTDIALDVKRCDLSRYSWVYILRIHRTSSRELSENERTCLFYIESDIFTRNAVSKGRNDCRRYLERYDRTQTLLIFAVSLNKLTAWHSGKTPVFWPANFPCSTLDLRTADEWPLKMWVSRPL